MSGLGATITVLATQLSEAVCADEAISDVKHNIAAGEFGKHVSDWIRDTAKELDDRAIEIGRFRSQTQKLLK